MRRTEWLIQFEQELTRLRVPSPREIVADYEEHFANAMGGGKPEDEVAAKLGDPVAAARAHQAESLLTKAVQDPARGPDPATVLRATFRLLVLTPFNFIMLIGPFLLAAVFLVVGWSLCLAVGAVCIAAFTVTFATLPFLFINFWGPFAAAFGSFALVGCTLFGVLTMVLISQTVLKLFVSYMRWNVDFVLEK